MDGPAAHRTRTASGTTLTAVSDRDTERPRQPNRSVDVAILSGSSSPTDV
jgi:hypothetical protein